MSSCCAQTVRLGLDDVWLLVQQDLELSPSEISGNNDTHPLQLKVLLSVELKKNRLQESLCSFLTWLAVDKLECWGSNLLLKYCMGRSTAVVCALCFCYSDKDVCQMVTALHHPVAIVCPCQTQLACPHNPNHLES